MTQTIAVEPNLTPVKNFLSSKGYQVESINFNEATAKFPSDRFDAFVVTGLNTNFMGIHDTNTKAVVIDAGGLTPEQVYSELMQRLA